MVRWIAVITVVGVGCFVGCFGGGAANVAKPAAFDGKRAMQYLKDICAIGPRMSGTAGMKKQQELMRKHFEGLNLTIRMQTFQAQQVSKAKPVEMANMIVSFAPDKKNRVILCSHYDTRPIADREERRKWHDPFVSANDGGSGVALLMELARHFKDLSIEVGVDLVFFDGEEYIFDPERDKYFFGSRHFAKTWSDDKARPNYRGAILLDMIGGSELSIPFEGFSRARHKELCDEIWGLAKALKCNAFEHRTGDHVQDDHLALQEVGIPAIDLIDFSYDHWHKLSDTPENCSADSLDQVARVLSVWIQRVR